MAKRVLLIIALLVAPFESVDAQQTKKPPRPKKWELMINLNAAKQIGLVMPPNMLARADRVIK